MLLQIVNRLLGKTGYLIVKSSALSTKKRYYIDCEQTVKCAKSEGLSVCDYVEKIWDQKGWTQKVVDEMRKYGCFNQVGKICEIGPGTGRYMEKILQFFSSYHIEYVYYEIQDDWAEWLEKTYPVIKRNTDGYTLKSEADNSCILVHAHGVFVYLNLVHSFQYFKEMIRVTQPGGYIVFDFYPIEFYDIALIEKCIEKKITYPVVLPAETIKSFFQKNECIYVGQFKNKHGADFSWYHIYQKMKS